MDKPRPIADGLTQPYWDAAAEGRLLIQRCSACERYQWYPRAHCVACGAADPSFVEAKGTGRLHTFTVLEKTPNPEFQGDLPYVLAVVELDEGVRVSANVVGVDHAALACEMPLRVTFVEGLPCFTTPEGS
jgi:uncharacterized OB-fold protein